MDYDRVIQIATNALPLRAVFSDGAMTPVVGLALVESKLDGLQVNVPCGIAIFNEGLVVCEQVDCFLGYAADKDEAQGIYDGWAKQQGSATEGIDSRN